eukprot:1599531-Rhodomonas_salina.1
MLAQYRVVRSDIPEVSTAIPQLSTGQSVRDTLAQYRTHETSHSAPYKLRARYARSVPDIA